MTEAKPWRLLYHNFEEVIDQVRQWKEPYQLAYTVKIIDDEPATVPTDEVTK
jgi:hypothetical protein